MSVHATATGRHFLTYRGVGLPLTLVEKLGPQALRHRNTFIRAGYDAARRLLWVEKRVAQPGHERDWATTRTHAPAKEQTAYGR